MDTYILFFTLGALMFNQAVLLFFGLFADGSRYFLVKHSVIKLLLLALLLFHFIFIVINLMPDFASYYFSSALLYLVFFILLFEIWVWLKWITFSSDMKFLEWFIYYFCNAFIPVSFAISINQSYELSMMCLLGMFMTLIFLQRFSIAFTNYLTRKAAFDLQFIPIIVVMVLIFVLSAFVFLYRLVGIRI